MEDLVEIDQSSGGSIYLELKEYAIGSTVIFSPYKNKDSKHELTYQKIGWWDEKFYLYFIPHAQSF